MNIEEFKCVEATIKVLNEEEPIKEWGINVETGKDHVIFSQGFRKIIYEKSGISMMDLHADLEKRR